MKPIRALLIATSLCFAYFLANAATVNDLSLTNQFGEVSHNKINSVTSTGAGTIGANIPSATVTAKVLTGFSLSSGGTIGAADTIVGAFGKLQKQLNNIAVVTCGAAAGGSASETLTCTGVTSTDTILAVTQKTAGTLGTALVAHGTPATNALSATWTGNPGAGAVVEVTVKH